MPRFTREHLFHIRPVGSLVEETHESGHELKRAVGPVSLTALGVGAIVGTGIFVVVGEGLARAGPAVILSFVLAAVVCLFSALSYAELASSIPVAGDIGGLLFVIGAIITVLLGLPDIRWFVLASVIVGAVLAGGLFLWRSSRASSLVPANSILRR